MDDRNRGIATLHAAMLATRLKKTAEAQNLYERLLKDESLKEMAPEARMGLLLGLYNMGKYKEILSQHEQQKDMKMPTKDGQVRLLMLLGQSAYKLKEYQKAADFFLEAEKAVRAAAEILGLDADLMIAEAEGLARATTFSNVEALYFVADQAASGKREVNGHA